MLQYANCPASSSVSSSGRRALRMSFTGALRAYVSNSPLFGSTQYRLHSTQSPIRTARSLGPKLLQCRDQRAAMPRLGARALIRSSCWGCRHGCASSILSSFPTVASSLPVCFGNFKDAAHHVVTVVYACRVFGQLCCLAFCPCRPSANVCPGSFGSSR